MSDSQPCRRHPRMDDKYRDMISDALSDNDESWNDVVAVHDATPAGGGIPRIHVWTARYVYYWEYNEGDERFSAAPRNPPPDALLPSDGAPGG